MAKSPTTLPSVFLPIKSAVEFISGKRTEWVNAMKGGDTDAARKAISSEGDIANLNRVLKRATEGFYN